MSTRSAALHKVDLDRLQGAVQKPVVGRVAGLDWLRGIEVDRLQAALQNLELGGGVEAGRFARSAVHASVLICPDRLRIFHIATG